MEHNTHCSINVRILDVYMDQILGGEGETHAGGGGNPAVLLSYMNNLHESASINKLF